MQEEEGWGTCSSLTLPPELGVKGLWCCSLLEYAAHVPSASTLASLKLALSATHCSGRAVFLHFEGLKDFVKRKGQEWGRQTGRTGCPVLPVRAVPWSARIWSR